MSIVGRRGSGHSKRRTALFLLEAVERQFYGVIVAI